MLNTMEDLQILSRNEMRNVKGGYIKPEFPGIKCIDSNGNTTKSTCYPYGCFYGSGWCGEDTCENITNC